MYGFFKYSKTIYYIQKLMLSHWQGRYAKTSQFVAKNTHFDLSVVTASHLDKHEKMQFDMVKKTTNDCYNTSQ